MQKIKPFDLSELETLAPQTAITITLRGKVVDTAYSAESACSVLHSLAEEQGETDFTLETLQIAVKHPDDSHAQRILNIVEAERDALADCYDLER